MSYTLAIDKICLMVRLVRSSSPTPRGRLAHSTSPRSTSRPVSPFLSQCRSFHPTRREIPCFFLFTSLYSFFPSFFSLQPALCVHAPFPLSSSPPPPPPSPTAVHFSTLELLRPRDSFKELLKINDSTRCIAPSTTTMCIYSYVCTIFMYLRVVLLLYL